MTWSWDQGRLDYYQFDELKKIAKLALKEDLRHIDHATLVPKIGLPFSPVKDGYLPWRNYSRTFKSAFIVTAKGDIAMPTKVGALLASDGAITADEYFHFLAQATTDPSPAFKNWKPKENSRYPLLFCLKFMLARASIGIDTTFVSEIVASYQVSNFRGDEGQTEFLDLISQGHNMSTSARQAAESIRVIAQISYLSIWKNEIVVSLSQEDAANMFEQLHPITGNHLENGDDELSIVTDLFPAANAELVLDFSTTVQSDTEEAGFKEGGKIRKTHLTIERNSKIRTAFFERFPSGECDCCNIDTTTSYPWTPRVLDLHHLLPLCSGARTAKSGTLLEDLVASCPTCHRAIHRFYDNWLSDKAQKDFIDAEQARVAYQEAKKAYKVAAMTC